MNSSRLAALALLAALLALAAGCKKKPNVAQPPAQATAPVIILEPEPEPAEPALPEPSARGDAPPVTTAEEEAEPAAKPKPRRRRPAQVAKTTPPPQPPASEPQPAEAQPAATITAETGQQADSAEQLLAKTDANVRSVNRELNESEKAMLRQIESFVAQAREALKVGDAVRAQNLAQKAHLLSTELAKR